MSDSEGSAENFEDAVEDIQVVDDALPWNPAELGIVVLDPTPSVPIQTDTLPHPESDVTRAMSVKIAHVKDDDGHHIVVGNEAKLTRCEDEPIRTPGAVQAFGVLVVLEQQLDALVVRQVSENSAPILGLTPKFLFSLECFTDTLPEAQADILWDNIQTLPDPELKQDDDQNSPYVFLLSGWEEDQSKSWTCWCAAHRPSNDLVILEFELEQDHVNLLYTATQSRFPSAAMSTGDSDTTLVTTSPEEQSQVLAEGPSVEDIMASTISQSKPIPAMERMRRAMTSPPSPSISPGRRSRRRRHRKHSSHIPSTSVADIFTVVAQINDQLGAATSLPAFLQSVVGIIKEITQFHRVLVYQFDEDWNGNVVAELVDWGMTRDLYRGLRFPASDIPPQARQLYAINQVRILYDREQPTARLVARSQDDLKVPLDMTHCYLRAMSPIHLKYLGNMGVRASMSLSIVAFESLWGLIACHSYGDHGMRVSFPIRQLLKLTSQSISRNVERLRYAQRLHTRRLINTVSSENHPTGYIVSNAGDLLSLFDSDIGVLVIGRGAKVLGPTQHQGPELLAITDYLRHREFTSIQASSCLSRDFPDLNLGSRPLTDSFAGILYIPLSEGGEDFIVFLRKGQLESVNWAGRPRKDANSEGEELEPRKSFQLWSEIVSGKSKKWSDEQLDTAGVLALVYGKFIEVWREKESAVNKTKLTSLLLSNARHEVRTPLNHIINYLELALNGPLDQVTKDNLHKCHAASKNLLFTINDLLDLASLEHDMEISLTEPFTLASVLEEATYSYKNEAGRRNIFFKIEISEDCPPRVVADVKKIRAALQNLAANALSHTSTGSIVIQCTPSLEEGPELKEGYITIQFIVSDTGMGISPRELDGLLEHVESSDPVSAPPTGVGLRLAVVAHIVEQLGGRLRVQSKLDSGSRVSFSIPVCSTTADDKSVSSKRSSLLYRSRAGSIGSNEAPLVEVI